MRHNTIHSTPDVFNNHEWVGNLSSPLLLNNNLLVRRDMIYVLSNGRRLAEHRMRYTVKPFALPLHISPWFLLLCLLTPLLLSKDMDHEILKGHNHIRWFKSPNSHMRSLNGLDIVVLHENLLLQVKEHLVFVGHDPTGVPVDVVERCDVSSFLVGPLDDISIHHQINEASTVSMIRIAPRGFHLATIG